MFYEKFKVKYMNSLKPYKVMLNFLIYTNELFFTYATTNNYDLII